MKIALISSYGQPLAMGLRYVSAYLKAQGHDVRVLLMREKRDTARAKFSPALLADLQERVRDVDLIGLSLMTNTFNRACVLTKAIREGGAKAPIVWGGVHPTLAPEESLEHADIACIGEGERSMAELAEALEAGRDPSSIQGLWFRRGEGIIRNPVRQLQEDLDALPWPDYDLEQDHYVADGDSFVPARPELLRGVLNRYRLQSARGCPFECSFCNNAALKKLHEGKGNWVRMRSVANVIAELQDRITRFPSITEVNVVDDLFFVRDTEDIAEFARLYIERINLPIQLDAYPTTLNAAKLDALRGVPLSLISMGIQSGSEDTLYNIYQRRTPLRRIAESIDLLASRKIPAEYHYIISNPYEPDANRVQTLHFAACHHRGPAIVRVFPLALYPGTPLYERAVGDGTISRRHEDAYAHTYINKLHMLRDSYTATVLRAVLGLKGSGVPAWPVRKMVSLLTATPVRRLLDRKWFPYATYGLYRAGHFVYRRIIQQCFLNPLRALRRVTAPAERPPTRPRELVGVGAE